jgi:hypothetical protein
VVFIVGFYLTRKKIMPNYHSKLLLKINSDKELCQRLNKFYTVAEIEFSNFSLTIAGFTDMNQETNFYDQLDELINEYSTNKSSYNAVAKIAGILACVLAILSAASVIAVVMLACPFAVPLALACTLVYGASALSAVTAFFSAVLSSSESLQVDKLAWFIGAFQELNSPPADNVAFTSDNHNNTDNDSTNIRSSIFEMVIKSDFLDKVNAAYLKSSPPRT